MHPRLNCPHLLNRVVCLIRLNIYSKLNENMEIQVNLGTLATVHLIRRPPYTCFTVLKEKHHFWQSVFYTQLIQGMNNILI